MAADAVVSLVLQQLLSVTQARVKLVTGVDKAVDKLKTNFEMLQAVLADAEQRKVKEEDVRFWLEKLKDVSYDMDEVLDTWNTAIMKRLQLEGSNDAHTLKSKVCSSFLFPYSGLRQNLFSHNIASKIKAINKSLDGIAKGKDIFNFKMTMTSEHQRVEDISLLDVSDVYVRDEEQKCLVSKLLGESSERQSDLHVISIVGGQGIGKTTLAKLAYNNSEVMNNFEKRIWVCVSHHFDQLTIAKAIDVALGGNNSGLVTLRSVIQKIHEFIGRKKFVLVLDDICVRDFMEWELFQLYLKNGLHGSKILVTTCNLKSAPTTESIDVITVDELSNEQCWTIFSRFAYFGKTLEARQELEEIGRKIASKCNSLPVTAKTLGSLLRYKETKQEWENILCNEMWKAKWWGEPVIDLLLVCYYDLPSMVKQCFTYCAMFPKGFNFEKDELIRLWMAQGYLGLDHNEDNEIVGGKCFNTLAMRSLFQEFIKDDDGSIVRCKMDNIVHGVAQFLSKNECCMIKAENLRKGIMEASYKKARHLTLMVNEGDMLPISIGNFKKVQSLRIDFNTYVGTQVTPKVLAKLFEELTSLRALQICFNICIPLEIGKLLHLRYLDLSSNTEVRNLPESLCELYNLQTLKIDQCENLEVLPEGIGKLINLRHLLNFYTRSLRYMPKGIESLTKLRTLSQFHLSGGDYGGKACSLEGINNCQHIESLDIMGIENSREVIDGFRQLKNNKKIRQLNFWFSRKNNKEAVIEAFQPPPNLQRLAIYEYLGESMSALRMMSLTNLRLISLIRCSECLHLPPLGKLPSLETLHIDAMLSVREVGNEFVGVERDDTSSSSSVIFFPKLKTLHFDCMPQWEVWDFGIEDDPTIMFMPSLHTLKLDECPRLEGVPKQLLEKAPLQNLSIQDCPILQGVYEKGKGDKWDHISHIPNIHI